MNGGVLDRSVPMSPVQLSHFAVVRNISVYSVEMSVSDISYGTLYLHFNKKKALH